MTTNDSFTGGHVMQSSAEIITSTVGIITSCSFTLEGLRALCHDAYRSVVQLNCTGKEPGLPPSGREMNLICVPGVDEYAMLTSMMALSEALIQGEIIPRALVLTDTLPEWFHASLLKHTGDGRRLCGIVTASPRAPLDCIQNFLQGRSDTRHTPLKGRSSYPGTPGLSIRESGVMVAVLGGGTIESLVLQTGLSRGTLYWYRWKGLRKLGLLPFRRWRKLRMTHGTTKKEGSDVGLV